MSGETGTIEYVLSVAADRVTFKIFTTAFRKVADREGTTLAGVNRLSFDITPFANGLYYYVLEAKAQGRLERKVGKLIIGR